MIRNPFRHQIAVMIDKSGLTIQTMRIGVRPFDFKLHEILRLRSATAQNDSTLQIHIDGLLEKLLITFYVLFLMAPDVSTLPSPPPPRSGELPNCAIFPWSLSRVLH